MDRESEQMFNILNTVAKLRNYSPLVCKFLDNVTKLFHAADCYGRRCYLLNSLALETTV